MSNNQSIKLVIKKESTALMNIGKADVSRMGDSKNGDGILFFP